ncbi:sodium:calcium antiporter [Tahibacter amnicola]|uniref:Sodium/calcium exchanger membrane region domain-containing protein n=1 Tax=Tahibacter amnicola TaxID=2976241 RepID=A0ABY6BFN7_9GAMM|nr:hypothetical protein [Tahibacter amnicola]UXI68843.1 hypothetical protein N4264_04080 [Tahibacter amnicola]
MVTGLGGLAAGALLIVLGGDSLAKGLTGTALNLRMSGIRTGLLVSGLAAALPALAASGMALAAGRPAMALGCGVGAALAALGLGLGLGASIRSLDVQARIPTLILAVILVAALTAGLLSWDGRLAAGDGVGLAGILVFVVAMVWRRAPREATTVQQAFATAVETRREPSRVALRVAVGAAVLVAGAHLAVRAISGLGTATDAADFLAGATVLGVVASLPLAASTAMASLLRQGDLAVGTSLMAAVATLCGAVGLCALVRPLSIPRQWLAFDLVAVLLFAVALIPMLRSDARLTRAEGATVLTAWVAYVLWRAFLASGG